MKVLSAILKISLAAAVSCFFIGCSMDSTEIIEHPDTAQPGAQFSVSIVDMYVLLPNGRTLIQAVQDDSLHFAAGLPSGWLMQNIRFYPATSFKMNKYMGTGIDTLAMIKAFMDSIALYKTRAAAMSSDAGNASYFRGKTFNASDSADSMITVYGDSVFQWLAYKGFINFNFPVGTPMDTVMPMDSLGADTSTGLDSIGMKIIPIFIFATIQAGNTQGVTNLFYYTKTGPMPTPADSLEPGSMAYASILISSSHAKNGINANQASSNLEVISNPFVSGNLIYFRTDASTQSKLSIYSAGGHLVQTIPAASGTVSWNKTNSSGMKVKPGSYIVKLEGMNGISKAKQFRIAR